MVRTDGRRTIANPGNIDFDLCVDVRVVNVGSGLWLVTPLSSEGRDWIEENVSEESTWWGSSLVVEGRYVVDLCDGMIDAGLVLCGEGE